MKFTATSVLLGLLLLPGQGNAQWEQTEGPYGAKAETEEGKAEREEVDLAIQPTGDLTLTFPCRTLPVYRWVLVPQGSYTPL